MKNRRLNCITINTDASFNLRKKTGGYAFYIVCDLFKIQKGGMFKVNPDNPQDAEMKCMVNALHTLVVQKELPPVKLIVINSDCLHSFTLIGRNKSGVGKIIADTLRELRKKMAFDGILPEFEFRHVKAHSDIKDARSWVNDWCDKEAKKWMRLANK